MKKKTIPTAQKRKILSVPETAIVLGESDRAVWQKIYRGMLPHRRWGRRVIILAEELDQYLQGLPGPTAAEVLIKAELAAR